MCTRLIEDMFAALGTRYRTMQQISLLVLMARYWYWMGKTASTYSLRMVSSLVNLVFGPKKLAIIALPVTQEVNTSLSLVMNEKQGGCVWL